MKKIIIFCILLTACSLLSLISAQQPSKSLAKGEIEVERFETEKIDNQLSIKIELKIDQLRLKSNRFMAFTPVIAGADGTHEVLKPIIISGRRQHILFERGENKEYTYAIEVRRRNKKPQQVAYSQTVAYQNWMKDAKLIIIEDLCGCGKVQDNTVAYFGEMP